MRGFTLIELISSLAIVAVLTGIAVPTISGIKNRSEATTRVNWIIGAVNYTRHAAISFRTMATLCPMDGSEVRPRCGRAWQQDLMVFSDKNRDGRFNNRDKIIQTIPALTEHGRLNGGHSEIASICKLRLWGYTNFQNGNFTYCSPDKGSNLIEANRGECSRESAGHSPEGRSRHTP